MAELPPPRWPVVAIVGGGEAGPQALSLAEELGAAVIRAGACLVTGGRGGVMDAASRGARRARGETGGPPILALLPSYDRDSATPWADLVLPTGLGHARNALVVAAADLVFVVGGGPGTLSELGLARKLGRPVMALAGSGGVADRALDLLPGDPGLRRIAGIPEAEQALRALLAPPDDEQAGPEEAEGEGP